jgi:glucose-1-phosphate adenylyltransferase
MTVYLFKTEVLIDLLKHNARESSHEFGGDIIPCLIPEIKTYAYRFVDYWAYARTVDSYYQTNMDLLRQKIPLAAWQIRTNLIERCNNAERLPAYCDGPVTNSVIGDGCVVKGRVRNSILSPGVIVEAGAEVADSIIFHDTRIGPDAVLKKVICDKDVQISEGARIGGDDRPHAKEKRDHQKPGIAVLGKGSIVPARTRIKADTVVYPSAVIDQAEIGPGEILR